MDHTSVMRTCIWDASLNWNENCKEWKESPGTTTFTWEY